MSATAEKTLTEHESEQAERANASGKTPVVFIHGLWLLPSSWDRWATFFEEAGYAAAKPGWPDDPETVAEAKAHPQAFAGKSIGQVADHMEQPRSSRMMWKIFRYAVDGANVVGIGTFSDHSTLYFYRGRELDDGSGLLQGGGKEMRFIKLTSAADAGRAEVKRMVRKAFRLAS